MIINIVLLVLLLVSFALLFGQGIWSNAITLINVLLAAVLATCLFEPVARKFESFDPSFTYYCDFLALWGLFAIFYIIFRAVSDKLSKTAVRFKKPIDLGGGSVLALWTCWILICFTTMSLHVAPLARNSFGGSFQPTPASKMFFGLAPDQKWLAFVQKVSRGSLATSGPEKELAPGEKPTGDEGLNVFDPKGEFVYKYAERRARYEDAAGMRVYRSK